MTLLLKGNDTKQTKKKRTYIMQQTSYYIQTTHILQQ